MIKIADIKDRKVFEGLEVATEIIRPVAGKWADGDIRTADHLQLTLRSKTAKPIQSVYAYLNYYDENGKELGYDFDSPKANINQGEDAKVSILLTPPENCAYVTLEVDGEYHSRKKCMACIVGLAVGLGLVLALQYFLHA